MIEHKIRVVIIDDHPMMRSGIKAYLATANTVECVGEASSGEEGVALCQTLQPQVVLMDLRMPGMGGVAAIQALRVHCPNTRIISLTSFGEPELVHEAVRAGVIGYLLKDVDGDVLIQVIEAANKGQRTLAPEAVNALMEIAANPNPPGYDLTDREHEVLKLIAQGQTNHQIAGQLGVSENTVRFHVGNILSKLEVGNRTEAVIVAKKYRLVA